MNTNIRRFCFGVGTSLVLLNSVPLLFGQQQMGRVPVRSEIGDRYQWDLTDIYEDVHAWESDFEECEADIKRLSGMKGTIGESSENLLAFLRLREAAALRLDKVLAFSTLLKDQDTRESGPQALDDRARSLNVRFGESVSSFDPEFLAIEDETLQGWMETQPKLAVFEHAFDNLKRERGHVLSSREEALLAMTGKLAATPEQVFSMLTNADLKFPAIADSKGIPIELSEGRYLPLMKSTDRALRQRAFKQLMGTYLEFKNTLSSALAGSIHKDVFIARARHYESALHAALAPDNVPVEVYSNLIGTVREHLPKLHRYTEIRRKRLGIDQVHIYDTFVPLITGEPPGIAYDDAVATIIRGLEPLGDEYLKPLKEGFQNHWIDVFETQGKRSGAYSLGIYSVHPYVLLSYSPTYGDMSTLAHEMGHAMHSWFTQHNQPPVYGDYPIFVAEVASTCNQILLDHYLRQEARDDTQLLFLVNEAVENIRGTVITQTMWAEFEMLLHAEAESGAPLTYETMSEIYRKLVKAYFGTAWAHDLEVDGYWLRIPHFYRGFYVYKYATSYCAATALADRILTKEPAALQAYLGFLKAGGSDYPIDLLKRAGVDMRTPEPIQATMKIFGKLLDELESLLERFQEQ